MAGGGRIAPSCTVTLPAGFDFGLNMDTVLFTGEGSGFRPCFDERPVGQGHSYRTIEKASVDIKMWFGKDLATTTETDRLRKPPPPNNDYPVTAS